MLPPAFEVTPSLSTPGMQSTIPRTFPDILDQGDFFRHHPTPKIKFRAWIRSEISQLGLSHLLLEDLHGPGKGFWYRPLMIAQDGHSSVGSIVGQELSCNIIFSWKEMKASLGLHPRSWEKQGIHQKETQTSCSHILSPGRAIMVVGSGEGQLSITIRCCDSSLMYPRRQK